MVLRRARTLILGIVATLLTGFFTVLGTGAVAHADSTLTYVHSPSMNKTIPVKVLRAAGGGPAPTLYLLDGLRAPDNDNGWLINTDVEVFFADKHVNVAIPFGGGGSFYTDWQRDDPHLGRQMWETFLTRELPGVMAAEFGSDGVNNAIAGLSMSGTSALTLAAKHPDMYNAVASFSGYPTAATPGFAQGIQLSVAEMGGNPFNMWGVWPAGRWLANDPLANVGNLRGKGVYISAGGGSPTSDPSVNPLSAEFDPVWFAQMVPLEMASGISSGLFVPAAQAAGARVQTHISADGIHWWNYWQDRLKEAWFGTLAPSLGV
ncbi:esterase family protein [Rhodococcus rhodnii]|uniref:Antigen 85 complex protein n=2 Tax=Rhodococcus rhodnii TaxID=38312 RepID=R7WLH1_9NOCA|nr:alpha/beta hydrolase family protein [Rhodococcus rhodnii]EOM76153.1 antigen 85 complex protein [Rhodococcus rhodnii LMG 5362]TXG91802.1 esterase family protein [Rhodococcus rhodnii]